MPVGGHRIDNCGEVTDGGIVFGDDEIIEFTSLGGEVSNDDFRITVFS